MEWTESGRGMMAFESPASPPPSRTLPSRIRKRLAEARASPPSTSRDLDARLRDADLRRQRFHAWLSSKARPKPRSPSWSSQEDDAGQRLEARLYAAEQKRLSLLAKAQMRLARLDELRQAAKMSVEMRLEREREKLGTKVESRVQQAEANRMLLWEANMQRRLVAQERKARSLMQRISRETKHRERVRMAISQKRAAAEKKRLGMLEAEKTRARSRVMQARRVARSVCSQRESERRRLKQQLEDRLQRARCQRAEYLKLRGGSHSTGRVTSKMGRSRGEILSTKLARCWRQFVCTKHTTLALAKEFQALNISESSVCNVQFDQLAGRIQSATTLRIVKSLLDRLECRLMALRLTSSSQPESIDHLLKHVASPNKRGGSSSKASLARRQMRNQQLKHHETKRLARYPVRVVLCAYMILGHPDAVFSGHGNCEKELAEAAVSFIKELELLILVILGGPVEIMQNGEKMHNQSPRKHTFRSQMEAFDAAWRSYLYRFVAWKIKDVKLLEEDLVRAACHLELSMMQTCKLTSDGQSPDLTDDMKAIQKQVTEDQQLLRERVRNLCGSAGIERMESALSDARHKFFEAKENGSSPMTLAHISSPLLPLSSPEPSDSPSKGHSLKREGRQSSVVRSLFADNDRGQSISNINIQGASLMENELFVNEILHDPHGSFMDILKNSNEDEKTLKAKVEKTMENAFWDGIMESLAKEHPDYERIVELVKEVRNDLCEMSPEDLKQEIKEFIDIDVLTQLFHSGSMDLDYLGKILEYSFGILQKLSAPAKEAEMKKVHVKMLQELLYIDHSNARPQGGFITVVIKGLRFLLEEIKALKKEISKARIQMLLPIIQSSAGIEYLQKGFAECFGPPYDAACKLPFTKQWLVSLQGSYLEWKDHTELLSMSESSKNIPVTTPLRSGGRTLRSPSSSQTAASISSGHDECKGERLDVLLRIGLLKLVTAAEGLKEGTLPETLRLNLLRLRSVQGKLQNIVVISTSMLVLRQILLSEKITIQSADVEEKVSGCGKNLCGLLDNVPDVGFMDIVETVLSSFKEEKLSETKEVLARVLIKSLQAGDVVFEKVNRSLYLAARLLVLGGSGVHVRSVAEAALRRIGAPMLLDRLVAIAETLVVVAKISGQVHASWYEHLLQT